MTRFILRFNKSVGTLFFCIASISYTTVQHFSTGIMVYNVIVCHYDGKISFTARRITMGENLRTIQLHFYVNEQEYEKIKEGKASAHIRGLSTYLRRMAIHGHIIHVDMSEIQKLTSLLGICSNNLNQYARKAHQTDSIFQADIEDLRERLNEIRIEVGKIMEVYLKVLSM